MQQDMSGKTYAASVGAMWDTSDMVRIETLHGRELYDALMLLKPAELSEYEWAIQAGVNRGFFNDLKQKGTRPRVDTLAKVLAVVRADTSPSEQPATPNARPFKMDGPASPLMYEDVPVYGTALGADEVVDGSAVEQTTLNKAEVIAYFKRPPVLNGRTDVYGIYIVGSSMSPRYGEGEVAFVEGIRHPGVGDDVVVYLRPQNESDDGYTADAALVKRLVRRTASYVELEQFSPAMTFKIQSTRVLRIDRVIPWAELVS